MQYDCYAVGPVSIVKLSTKDRSPSNSPDIHDDAAFRVVFTFFKSYLPKINCRVPSVSKDAEFLFDGLEFFHKFSVDIIFDHESRFTLQQEPALA
jgi:hypothetical protein